MIEYAKGPEPTGLEQARATPGAVWNHPPSCFDKQAVREALTRDQQGLCAYCQRRIKPYYRHADDALASDRSTRVEHWHARAAGGAHFQWSNLLGVCKGIVDDSDHPDVDHGRPVVRVETCDTVRGSQPLQMHPVRGQGLSPRSHLTYLASGRIIAKDARASADLQILGLNAPHLIRGRAAAFDALRRFLGARYNLRQLRSRLKLLQTVSIVPEFAEVERQFLGRQIDRWRTSL